MKVKFVIFAFVFASFAFATAANAQEVMRTNIRRTIYRDCVPLSSMIDTATFKRYSGLRTLNGMHKVKASELGWAWVYNEVGSQMCKTELDPDIAYVWVVNGDSHPTGGYLEGCYFDGHPFKNRVIPIEEKVAVVNTPAPTPPPPPPTPMPCQPGDQHKEDIIQNGVKVGERVYDNCKSDSRIVLTNTITNYLNPCPTDVKWDEGTSLKTRLTSGPWQGLGSGLGSAGISAIRGARGKDIFWAGVWGGVTQRVEQAANAPEDHVTISIPSLGINNREVHKGRPADLGQGISLAWDGDHVALYRTIEGRKFRCDADALKDTSNLAIWSEGQSNEESGGCPPGQTPTGDRAHPCGIKNQNVVIGPSPGTSNIPVFGGSGGNPTNGVPGIPCNPARTGCNGGFTPFLTTGFAGDVNLGGSQSTSTYVQPTTQQQYVAPAQVASSQPTGNGYWMTFEDGTKKWIKLD